MGPDLTPDPTVPTPDPTVPTPKPTPTSPQVDAPRSRFRAAPPRRFLYPALLLLLAEEPRHGYRLVEALPDLGLDRIDRASVYRALADLDADGLVWSWDEPPAAGTTRHVYELTPGGVTVLEEWMSVVAAERTTLDAVLQRYWYCSAHELPAGVVPGPGWSRQPDDHRPDGHQRFGPADPAGEVAEPPIIFEVASDRSHLTVEARTNIGPLAFAASGLRGWTRVTLSDGLVTINEPPQGHLEVDLASLRSGNAIYDSELIRRIDARRYPSVTVELRDAERLGEGNCFEATGEMTLRGVTRPVTGELMVTIFETGPHRADGKGRKDRQMTVTGGCVLDLREFSFEPPAMTLLKLYPDVRLRLHVEAEAAGPPPADPTPADPADPPPPADPAHPTRDDPYQ